jgi:hypothetical protein
MSSVVETRKASPTLKNLKSDLKEETPADLNLPDNYVSWSLKNQKPAPPITLGNLLQNIQWVSFIVLTVTPSLALYGALTVKLRWETAVWSVIYYFITGLGESSFMPLPSVTSKLTFVPKVSPPATIVYGHIAHTTRLYLSNTSWPWLEPVPLRGLSSGGLADTVHTTVTPTPTLTPTMRTRASGGRTSAG